MKSNWIQSWSKCLSLYKKVNRDITNSTIDSIVDIEFVIPGVYIICIYDSLSYIYIVISISIGIITVKSIENCDSKVKFKKKVNQCCIPYQDILRRLQTPNIINSRQYKCNSKIL